MVGRRFSVTVTDDRGEEPIRVTFLVVDPECPTVRNVGGYWPSCGLHFLRHQLWKTSVEKVLVTPTNPVLLIVVYATYPRLRIWPLRLTKSQFEEFRFVVCAPREKPAGGLWLKEGF